MTSSPRSRRTALAPSGSGRPPVSSCHHSPRSMTRTQPLAAVGELALVDDQAGVDLAVGDDVEDPVERHDHRIVDAPHRELELQVGAGQRPGIATRRERQLGRLDRLAGHHHGAVALAHRRAVGQQPVPVGQVGVGVDGQRGDLEPAVRGPAVEGLDVAQDVLETEAAGRDELLGQRVEHERVVGVRAVAQPHEAIRHRRDRSGAPRAPARPAGPPSAANASTAAPAARVQPVRSRAGGPATVVPARLA